LEKARPF